MKSFSTAIISDSVAFQSSLPAATAITGMCIGTLLGFSAATFKITNYNIFASTTLMCLDIFLYYSLVSARDPKSPLKCNYFL